MLPFSRQIGEEIASVVSDFELCTRDGSGDNDWKFLSLRMGAVPRKHSIVSKITDDDKTVTHASVA